MAEFLLQDNEIVVNASAVKYHDIQYNDNYVVIQQNRTRRRVYKGYYFEDTGTHIYVSAFCAGMFQHKNKVRQFIVDTITKEWRDFKTVFIERHMPEKREVLDNNEVEQLRKWKN